MSLNRKRLALAVTAVALGAGATACSLGTSAGNEADPNSDALVRPDTPGNSLQFHFDDSDLVETYPDAAGGSFLVHYTRTGPNAVPATDADLSTVPDFVEQVATTYAEVLTHYRDTLGFRAPVSDADGSDDNGGDDRFDVYLVDFGGVGDGNYQNDECTAQNSEICPGYMVQENDFSGYGYPSTTMANRILASHEFFHAVEAAYDTGQGSVLAEGAAVWATESFDSTLPDFEYFVEGFFANPDHSLDLPMPGPTDPFSYGAGIFFQFLEERYGSGKVRALLERCVNGANGIADPQWFAVLEPMLQAEAGVSFADAFVEFATYNLFTRGHADPARGYARGASYDGVAMREQAAPYLDDALRVFYASSQYYRLDPAGRTSMTAALVAAPGNEAELEGMHVLMTVDQGDGYGPVTHLTDPTAGTEGADTTTASHFVVVVVNTLQQGESQRPGLCIGTPAEVASCRDTLLSAGAGGAGGGGAGGAAATEVPEETDEGGCSCRAAVGARANATASRDVRRGARSLGLLSALGLLALGVRRKRSGARR